MSDQEFVRIICIDFDGVIHSYTSGWKGAHIVDDPPVKGAIDWLIHLVKLKDFKPVIYSSRSRQEGGIKAMKTWLFRNGMEVETVEEIEFPTQKPAAFLTIDDRAICFDGWFPSPGRMRAFTPWNKKGV